MRWKTWIIVLLLPWLAACSAVRLTYGQGPTLVYWWLDNYADFNAEQAPRVRAALVDWFAWHRGSQLPEYAQALAALQTLAANPVTAAQACSTMDGWQRRAELAFDRAVPAVAEQMRSLSAEQISHLEKRQRVKQAELTAEYQQADPAERAKGAFKRMQDRAESIYGPLNDAQHRLLAAGLAASPFSAERWLAERRQRQTDIVRSLRQWQAERPDADTVQTGLRRLATDISHSPRADYQAYNERLNAAYCAQAATLHNSTTPKQRQRAIDKLRGWEGDLRALIER